MTAPKREHSYCVETTRAGPDVWHWEIMRNGRPLDARLREGPFKSERTAMAAGTVALNDFLRLLRQEEGP